MHASMLLVVGVTGSVHGCVCERSDDFVLVQAVCMQFALKAWWRQHHTSPPCTHSCQVRREMFCEGSNQCTRLET